MKNFKDWFTCQLLSKSLLSIRPFSFFDEETPDEQSNRQGTTDVVSVASPASTENPHPGSQILGSSVTQHLNLETVTQHLNSETSELVQYYGIDKNTDALTKVEALQINFLRLVHQIGHSPNNLVVAQVLYRLHLASLIRAGEQDSGRHILKIDEASNIAVELEAAGHTNLNFSFKVLLLGRTGVGKSAIINSIFDQGKVATDAFQPSTDCIQEITGTVRGVKVTFIDTPGLSWPYGNQRRNRKILLAVRKFIRRSPPDIVFYVDRLDGITSDLSEYPLMKLVTDIFGSSIWLNTILVLTHAGSHPPEGPDGFPLSYEVYVNNCKNVVQHYVHQAINSVQLENPVLLVENHHMCRRNNKGEKVLPNGEVWLSHFLLLCIAMKVLGDANSYLKFKDTFSVEKTSTRVPSLPHLLSSLLRTRSLGESSGVDDDKKDDLLDHDDADEYDQLPPIRVLTKSQFQKLSKCQKNAYLDELDYRETLYLKKQWKEELRRRRQKILTGRDVSVGQDNNDDDDDAVPEAVQLPDMSIPLSFDSDSPIYRYRCLMGSDQWLIRPVLDSQGWDHDVGFDGINMEGSQDIERNTNLSIVGQISKDKIDFNIQSECKARYMTPRGHAVTAGLEVQSAGKNLMTTVHTDAKVKNFSCNSTGCGLSLISYGNMHFVGAKVEDSISFGRRCRMTTNAGKIRGHGQVANGGAIEVAVRGKDYPVRDEKVVLGATLLSFEKETVLSGSFQSDFRVGRDSKLSLSGNLNSRQMGQICVRINTTAHVEIALIAVVSVFQALFRMKTADSG